jgi:hypothetical protein
MLKTAANTQAILNSILKLGYSSEQLTKGSGNTYVLRSDFSTDTARKMVLQDIIKELEEYGAFWENKSSSIGRMTILKPTFYLDVKANKGNKGDIAEAVFAAALFSKLIARTKTGIEKITPEDVWETLQELKNATAKNVPGKKNVKLVQFSKVVSDVYKNSDNIGVRIALGNANYKALLKSSHGDINGVLSGSVAFSNSENIEKLARALYINNESNHVEVQANGPLDQTGTKSDILIFNHDTKKTIDAMSFSLKFGSKQFGQIGGGDWNKLSSLFSKFNIDISSIKNEFEHEMMNTKKSIAENTKHAAQVVYSYASNKIANDSVSFFDSIKHFMVGDDKDISLVSLSTTKSGGYHQIVIDDEFKRRFNKLKFKTAYSVGSSSLPKITIIREDTNKPFLTIRMKYEIAKNYFRNYIEKERGLLELFQD